MVWSGVAGPIWETAGASDRKSTRLNSSHGYISYAVFCLKKKKKKNRTTIDNSNHLTYNRHRRINSRIYESITPLYTARLTAGIGPRDTFDTTDYSDTRCASRVRLCSSTHESSSVLGDHAAQIIAIHVKTVYIHYYVLFRVIMHSQRLRAQKPTYTFFFFFK